MGPVFKLFSLVDAQRFAGAAAGNTAALYQRLITAYPLIRPANMTGNETPSDLVT